MEFYFENHEFSNFLGFFVFILNLVIFKIIKINFYCVEVASLLCVNTWQCMHAPSVAHVRMSIAREYVVKYFFKGLC